MEGHVRLGLEELDEVAGGVLQQGLPSTPARDHLAAEGGTGLPDRAMVASRSSTSIWNLFHPPGSGTVASGIA